MKLNRRLAVIALISLAAAAAITAFAYDGMKRAAAPEATAAIAYFKADMPRNTVVNASDFIFKPTPISLVPKTAVRDTGELAGKTLVANVEEGDMALPGKLIERGDALVDVRELWTIGLDVTNISSYLGGNLKEGKEYILLYRAPAGSVAKIAKVKISSLVDGTGRLITSVGDGVVKTVNVSMAEEATLTAVARAKAAGTFELVEAPEGYEFVADILEPEAAEETDTGASQTDDKNDEP